VGPILGGFLFQIGGFRLPFFFMGGLLFCVFLTAFFIFPDIKPPKKRANNASTLSIMPLLKTPRYLLTMQMLFIGSLSIGFIEPSIQVHLAPVSYFLIVNYRKSLPIRSGSYNFLFVY
jgi:predicted MFS family arabinose efflux permease